MTKREAFRQQSFAGLACRYHFVGEGRDGYVHAMETLKRDIEGSLVILHGMRRSEWEACRAAGAVGAQLPEGGFLHCSPVEYFWRVAPGHYADGGDYVLLCIDVKKVPAPIKWEAGPHNPSRYYPHIYGACPVEAVTTVLPLRTDSRGQFVKNPELSGYENR